MLIQLLGASGTLGAAVRHELARHGLSYVVLHQRLEFVTAFDIRGELMINCAGLVKQAAAPESRFIQVNAFGPQRLAEACDANGARLVHVSTDCVFDHPGPHDEADIPTAEDIYAISKRAGEVTRWPHLTVRTSFVGYGARGLIHDLQAGDTVRASDNLLWTGHTAPTIAALLVDLALRPDVAGLLHVPGQEQSRWQLVNRLQDALGTRARLVRDDAFVADRRLISTRWAAFGLPDPPPFEQQLQALGERVP